MGRCQVPAEAHPVCVRLLCWRLRCPWRRWIGQAGASVWWRLFRGYIGLAGGFFWSRFTFLRVWEGTRRREGRRFDRGLHRRRCSGLIGGLCGDSERAECENGAGERGDSDLVHTISFRLRNEPRVRLHSCTRSGFSPLLAQRSGHGSVTQTQVFAKSGQKKTARLRCDRRSGGLNGDPLRTGGETRSGSRSLKRGLEPNPASSASTIAMPRSKRLIAANLSSRRAVVPVTLGLMPYFSSYIGLVFRG